MRPAMSGRITSRPNSCSKARRTASLWNVPPCTTIRSPSSAVFFSRMTLNRAFLTMETEMPAEISRTSAPSFCTCLTLEFINTVQRVPKSTGRRAVRPRRANSCAVRPRVWAKVSMNEPHPEEQASLSTIESMTPSRTWKLFMSCPPMSSTNETSGRKCRAAVRCATVSTSPKSSCRADLIRDSP